LGFAVYHSKVDGWSPAVVGRPGAAAATGPPAAAEQQPA